MIRILPYKMGSASARELSQRLGVRRMRPDNSAIRFRNRSLVINWGCPRYPQHYNAQPHVRFINDPNMVANAANKLLFFNRLHQHNDVDPPRAVPVSYPEYTTDRQVAETWLADGFVVARRYLRGSAARGLVLVRTPEEMVNAPLYTRYIKKAEEYRIHVMNGNVFHMQQKRRRLETPDEQVDWQVRNHHNGWVFTIQDVNPPVYVVQQAQLVMQVVGLDFGAVDIVWNQREGKAYVLEINTAPGLEGTTLDRYVEHIQAYYL